MVREGLLQRQARRVLENEKYALLAAMLLAALPYMGWLALALVALVTLRKGVPAGGKLLIPVMLVHVLLSMISAPVFVAILGACLNVVPCYLAACVLRLTSSWRAVAGLLLGLVVLGVALVQGFTPDFIGEQYAHLEAALQALASSQVNILDFWASRGASSLVLAHYLLGVQAASLAFSAMVPLFFARSIQSQLFYSGGFREEMLTFRGDKTSLMVLVSLIALAYSEQFLAIDALPLVLFYFILAGLSLAAHVFSHRRPLLMFVLLVVPMVLLSWVMLPLYVALGAFDSLFNFRVYLSSKTGKAT
jgi:hypothetical protein